MEGFMSWKVAAETLSGERLAHSLQGTSPTGNAQAMSCAGTQQGI